jgi:hypothetical protein
VGSDERRGKRRRNNYLIRPLIDSESISEGKCKSMFVLVLDSPSTTPLHYGQRLSSRGLSLQRRSWSFLNTYQFLPISSSTRSVLFILTLIPSPSLLPTLASPRPPQLLESTQDLISRFHLLTAYDKFVRPFITQDHDPNSNLPTTPAVASSPDKGKGRERDPGTPTIASAATPGTHHDPDDDEGRDGKKKKNTYRHLIKGVPGT